MARAKTGCTSKFLKVLVLLVLFEHGRSVTNEDETEVLQDNIDKDANKIEMMGDVRLSELTRNRIEQAKERVLSRKKRLHRRDRRYLWNDKVIPYEIGNNIKFREPMIKAAIREIESNTCLRFVEKDDNTYQWIKFVLKNIDVCSSDDGRQYKKPGPMEIWLAKRCETAEILHEIMHALGFLHEVQRPDRDKYVDIHWDNIIEKYINDNFKILYVIESDLEDYGLKYDYYSILHYSPLHVSKNNKYTVTAKGDPDNKLNIGMNRSLSNLDIVKLNMVYACQTNCSGSQGEIKPKKLSSLTHWKQYKPELGYVGTKDSQVNTTWCSSFTKTYHKDYLQIEVAKQTSLCAVTTTGNAELQAWVMEYSVKYSLDGVYWKDLINIDGSTTFLGVHSADQTQRLSVSYPIQAKYFRFIPEVSHKRACMKVKLFHGEPLKRLSPWSQWSPCDTYKLYTPGRCVKYRQRFCSPANTSVCAMVDEHGVETQEVNCTKEICEAPVNGQWGPWSQWGECKAECGNGTTTRTRKCDSPAARFNGTKCKGPSSDTKTCYSVCNIRGKDGCTFTNDFCGWTQSPYNYEKWGLAKSLPNGPSKEHSFVAPKGYFITMRQLWRKLDGAILRSPLQPGSKEDRCFSFYYYMNGTVGSTLSVLLQDASSSNRTTLKTIANPTGDKWMQQNITYRHNFDHKILLHGYTKTGLANIAVDDVDVLWGPCKNASHKYPDIKPTAVYEDYCDFETGFCNWKNANKHVDFNWTRGTGSTPTDFTGPSGDRTNYKSTGYYTYIETSGPRKVGDRARLVYKNLTNAYKSIAFWFYMNGEDVWQLSVIQRTEKTDRILFMATSNQGNIWRQAQIALIGYAKFSVIIEAVRGHGERGDIALDDIYLGKRSPKIRVPGYAVSITRLMRLSNCSFDGDQKQCGWRDLRDPTFAPAVNGKSSTFSWKHHYGPEPNKVNPSLRKPGFMIMSSKSRKAGDIARLVSTEIYIRPSNSICLKYSIYMNGTGQILNVYLSHSRFGKFVGSHNATKKLLYKWHKNSIPLTYSKKRKTKAAIKLVFEGVIGKPGGGDILLDDVEIVLNSKCKTPSKDVVQ